MQTSIGPWQQLTDDVWTTVCEPESVNVGLVAGTDHVLLVDAGSTPDQGRALADSAGDLVGRPVDRVVITHAHYDHYFGLAGIKGAESLGHESLVRALGSEETAARCTQMGISAADLVAPTHPFSLVRALDLGGLRIEMAHFGPAHTQGDVLVSVPDRRVWFTGDLVETAGDVQIGPESSVQSWPMALDGIIGGATDQTIYVPGHGPVTNRMGIYDQRTRIGMFYGSVEALVHRGVRLEAALEALDNPGTAENSHPAASEWEWPFATETVRAALPKVYEELAGLGQVPRTQLSITGL